MAERYDAVIIGGGHNGLVSAAYLARAGMKTLVLEQRHVLGGAAVTEELFPGFRFSRLLVRRLAPPAGDHPRAPAAAPRPRHPAPRRDVHAAPPGRRPEGRPAPARCRRHRRLPLARQRPRPDDPRAPPLVGRATPRRTRNTASSWSRWPGSSSRSSGSRRPDLTSLDPRPLLPLGGLLRSFQQLPERQQAVFVQLMTMSAADFLDQWFETDPLKATMSASGIIGTYLGVRSPGTAYVLLHHYMGEIDGAFRAWGIPKGGTGGISNAIGVGGAGARRRDPDRGAGRAGPRQGRPGGRRRPRRLRRGDPRPTSSCPPSTPDGRSSGSSSRARSTPSSRRRSAASSSAAAPAR